MNLNDFKKMKSEMDKQVAKNGERVLKEEFVNFFDKFPEVGAVRWTQYTPHFNDGDVCEFSRHIFEISLDFIGSLKEDSEFEDESFHGDWCTCYNAEKKTDCPAIVKKATKYLNKVFDDDTEELFEATFGDGVQVVALRDGFQVEDYDHD